MVLEIIGAIDKEYRTKKALNQFLARILFSNYYTSLQDVEGVTITNELSDHINPKLTNQTLNYRIEKTTQKITITDVHSDKNVKYISQPITLLNE